ncbi:hypothetical protein OF83DRAFT_1152250 [Amylostereum chailletii]|nr:hypothetical protein OF83DRAFT_1152250 [Amylostereum chailletii]
MDKRNFQRVPPYLANVHQACYHCSKSNLPLQRCSRCRRVSYDSPECQKADWKAHKQFCAAHKATDSALSEDDPPLAPTEDTHVLNERAEGQVHARIALMQDRLNRPLTIPERNLVAFEPRCLVCSRSDFEVRAAPSTTSTTSALRPCPSCNITFFCSDAHRDFGKRIHQEFPDPDSPTFLTQCTINSHIFIDLVHKELLQGGQEDEFSWAPERTKQAWESLVGKDWMGAFVDDLPRDLPGPDSFVRLASDLLSFPMTILWGLECINEDNAWATKDTLIIHVIGASQKEVMHSSLFEEIMHRLPAVKSLQVACFNYSRPYHTFVQRSGTRFVAPDLAIAFNSGCGSEETASWRPTIKLLVDMKIPTVFTSYQREEAGVDAALLKASGANLLPLGGPNPWGSQLLIVEPLKVRGYYANNGFIAGVFR